MVTPDNKADRYGGFDLKGLYGAFAIALLIIVICLLIYIFYIKYKMGKLEDQIYDLKHKTNLKNKDN